MRPTPILAALALLAAALCPAEDWPTYRHDNRRTNATAEALPLPLEQAWVWQSPVPPQTAWSGPAKWDAYAMNQGLQSMRSFDPAFFVTAAGDRVFFGSSADDGAHCLDAATGEERWVFFADAPVRLPPTYFDGRVYFGADDGVAYCLDAADAAEVWRFRGAADRRLIVSNSRMISAYPCRTGVLVHQGAAIFGNSLVPWEPSYLTAVECANGSARFSKELAGVTLQGALLAAGNALFSPQGRLAPKVFDLQTGEPQGEVAGAGGVFCVLSESGELIAGPRDQKAGDDILTLRAPGGEAVAAFPGANQLVLAGDRAFFHDGRHLNALDTKRYAQSQKDAAAAAAQIDAANKQIAEAEKAATDAPDQLAAAKEALAAAQAAAAQAKAGEAAATLWRERTDAPHELMFAGSTLFLGLEGKVAALDAKTGKHLWEAPAHGKVHGLAAAHGRLFASTDRGAIHCFAKAAD